MKKITALAFAAVMIFSFSGCSDDDVFVSAATLQADEVFVIEDEVLIKCNDYVSDEIVIPDGVTVIGEGSCRGLEAKRIKIPDSVTVIEGSDFEHGGAFSCCFSLKYVTVPSSVREIGDYAFSYCGNLTDLELSEGLEKIGESAFAGCEGLEYIELPYSVEQIGACAFGYFHPIDDADSTFSVTHRGVTYVGTQINDLYARYPIIEEEETEE